MEYISNQIIKDKLSKKDARRLWVLTRKHIPGYGVSGFEKEKTSHLNSLKKLKKQNEGYLKDKYSYNSGWTKREIDRLSEMIEIHKLYLKVCDNENIYMKHWISEYKDQIALNTNQNSMAPNPRQDNKTYINRSCGRGYCRDIRKPKKKRKTAWKRFAKLFPNHTSIKS